MSQLTPPPIAPQRGDRTTFAERLDAFITWLVSFVAELNIFSANLNSTAAGGAYSIPYTFGLQVGVGTAGGGVLAFDTGTDSTTTPRIWLDTKSAGAKDFASVLDTFDASTSTVKGEIRLVKVGDPSAFLVFDMTARGTSPSYRTLAVTRIGGSAASPFIAGESVMLFFTRNGDRGIQGVSGFSNLVVITGTQTWTPPAGITKAEITVQDGGSSSSASVSQPNFPGKGGNASVSVVAVDPAVTYTATVGAGGVGGAAGSGTASQAGGTSSFSGTGLTTLTSASGQVKTAGGDPILITNNGGFGGSSMFCGMSALTPPGYGGGAGANNGITVAGTNGKAGVVLIRY